MAKDKKNNSSNINLVLLKKIGHPIINREYKKNNLSTSIFESNTEGATYHGYMIVFNVCLNWLLLFS